MGCWCVDGENVEDRILNGEGRNTQCRTLNVQFSRGSGERAHWVQVLLLLVFALWTPLPWAWLMVGYAVFSNAPCIASLRYARLRIEKLLKR